MRHQNRMPPPVGTWATGLMARVSSAWHNGAALSEARQVLGKVGFLIAVPGLDAAYQRQLVALTRSRRAVASVATSRKRLELQIAELERKGGQHAGPASTSSGASPDGPGLSGTSGGVGEQLADLRRQYADAQAKEERVAAASRRLMAEVNALRTGIAATKAAYAAAEDAAAGIWAEISRHPELGPGKPAGVRLSAATVVDRSRLGGGPAAYHLASATHGHLICEHCGAMTEVPSELFRDVAETLAARYDFAVDPHRLAITGHCAACR